MILQEFTWQQFLVASAVFTLIWYGALYFFYLRRVGHGGNEPLPHVWQNDFDDLDYDPVGAAGRESGVSVLEADEFSFVPKDYLSGTEDPTSADDLPRDAYTEEFRTGIIGICTTLEREDGSKDLFMSLFAELREKYPLISVSDNLSDINDFIREHVPFFLSDQELERLWM